MPRGPPNLLGGQCGSSAERGDGCSAQSGDAFWEINKQEARTQGHGNDCSSHIITAKMKHNFFSDVRLFLYSLVVQSQFTS